jgi:hypothetical protein
MLKKAADAVEELTTKDFFTFFIYFGFKRQEKNIKQTD